MLLNRGNEINLVTTYCSTNSFFPVFSYTFPWLFLKTSLYLSFKTLLRFFLAYLDSPSMLGFFVHFPYIVLKIFSLIVCSVLLFLLCSCVGYVAWKL